MTNLSAEEKQKIKAALNCTDIMKCKHCVENGGDMESERYVCELCGDTYKLYYDEMR